MPRDRHGRVLRVDGDPRRRPAEGFRVRGARRFQKLLHDAIADLPAPAAQALGAATVQVVDVPPVDPDADEVVVADAEADGPHVHRLVVYRRPAELRASDREDLIEALREAVLEAVAGAVGADPDDWDPS